MPRNGVIKEAAMAEQDQNDQHDGTTDDGAEQLPADAVEASGAKSESATDDTDWKAQAEKWKKLSRQNEKTAADRAAALQKYEDANKSESQRLQEERDQHLSRADKAEAALKRREIAEVIAPAHATLTQIKAVAKRMAGDSAEDLEADARELFELLAPEPEEKPAPKTTARPKEKLRGGSAPDDEDIQPSDPRKLAALIPRRR